MKDQKIRAFSTALGALALATVAASVAHAETLADAIALAYDTNPTLQQARAQQRALDENIVQAKAGWRPTIGITATDDYERVFNNPVVSVNSGGASLTVAQNIFTNGRTTAAVKSAQFSIEAGRESLRSAEASVLQSVIQSYMDVLRDQSLLGIRQDDLQSLNRVLDEISAKRAVGAITRTDVVQIQAQVALAQAALAFAQAQLQISRANYAAAVGQNPGTLVPPPPLAQLPKDVDAAFDTAEAESPALEQAKASEAASRAKVAEARAANGPTVAVGAQIGYTGSSQPAQVVDYDKALTAQVTLTQPIFTGGVNSSLIRQAIEANASDRIGIEKARRQVVQSVSEAWNQVISAERMQTADKAAMDAATLELEGMQQEYRLALRTTLEVLSADEALRSTQIAITNATHDEYVSQANLLGAIGRLEAKYVITGAPQYDPKTHYNKIKNKGATPYEPIVAIVDGVTTPFLNGVKPLRTVGAPKGPVAMAPGTEPDANAPLATASRTQ